MHVPPPRSSLRHWSSAILFPWEVHLARDQIFISYCHEDKKWFDELKLYLKPYEKRKLLSVWDDTRISAGALWKDEIKTALDRTKVAVLLVTQHFMASDFIQDEELPDFLEASQKEGLLILWIPVSASTYRDSPLAHIQAAAEPGKPLDTLDSSARNMAWVHISDRIKAAVNHP